MKRVLLSVFAAVLVLAGCTKNETLGSAGGGENAIVFGPYSHLASRGVPVENNKDFSVVGNVFGAIAFFHGSGAAAKPYLGTGEGTPQSAAAPVQVTCDADKAWKYDNIKYWPSEGLDFYAYAPYTDAAATRVFSFAQNEVKVEYTVPADPALHQDFMVSGQWNKTRADVGADHRLAMPFRHVLTQVVFKFANVASALEVKIDSIKINNAKNSGTFTFDSAAGTGEYGAWVLGASVQPSYVQTLAAPLTVPASLPASPVEMTDGVLMLMPQQDTTPWDPATPDAGGTSIDITCTITDTDSGVLLWGTPTQNGGAKGKDLRIGVNFSDWKMGKRVIYCITFGNEGGKAGNDPVTGEAVLLPILFSPSVVGWDDTNHNINI